MLSHIRLCDPMEPARLLCPWNFPGKNTRVGCHFLLQGIFLTQGSNLHLLHWQANSFPLGHLGSSPKFHGISLTVDEYRLTSLKCKIPVRKKQWFTLRVWLGGFSVYTSLRSAGTRKCEFDGKGNWRKNSDHLGSGETSEEAGRSQSAEKTADSWGAGKGWSG